MYLEKQHHHYTPVTYLAVSIQYTLLGILFLEEVGLSLQKPQDRTYHLLRIGLMFDQQITQNLIKGSWVEKRELLDHTRGCVGHLTVTTKTAM